LAGLCHSLSTIDVFISHSYKKSNTVGSRFTTELVSRIFGCKSNRRKTNTI